MLFAPLALTSSDDGGEDAAVVLVVVRKQLVVMWVKMLIIVGLSLEGPGCAKQKASSDIRKERNKPMAAE